MITGTVSIYPVSGPMGAIMASCSQFFISFKAMPNNTTPLNIFGQVVDGMDIALNLVADDVVAMITITERIGLSGAAPTLAGYHLIRRSPTLNGLGVVTRVCLYRHTGAHTPMYAGPPASNGETGAPGAKLGSWVANATA